MVTNTVHAKIEMVTLSIELDSVAIENLATLAHFICLLSID
jgi:hypothetical protein